ncbi:hypothetical protein PINS_up008051 [Pythium insidiosum]|nr:hypothetical protein PINS_up008051 [Pythium insidiosum]
MMLAPPCRDDGATTLPSPPAAIEERCGWCGEAPWAYCCAMCDTRVLKRVCPDCSVRWHARGFARLHVLEDRHGVKRSFAEWTKSPAPESQPEQREDAPTEVAETLELLPEIAEPDAAMEVVDPNEEMADLDNLNDHGAIIAEPEENEEPSVTANEGAF